MRFFVFLFLSCVCLFSFAGQKVTCSFVQADDGGVFISCAAEDGVPVFPQDMPQLMTEGECESIKTEVTNILHSVSTELADLRGILESDQDICYRAQVRNDYITYTIDEYILNNTVVGTNLQSVADTSRLLSDDLFVAYNSLIGSVGRIDEISSDVTNSIKRVEAYVCVNQECSGTSSGNLSCPCQSEFNSVLSAVNAVKDEAVTIRKASVSNSVALVKMLAQTELISDAVCSITNRLNSPDDRMWSELNDIYTVFASNTSIVAASSLNLQTLLYHLRQMINGNGNGGKMELSTEGVLSLYDTVFGMARTVQSELMLNSFHQSVIYFSNTVSRLFQTYDSLVRYQAQSFVPSATRYDYIAQAFTNNSLQARTRYARLANGNGGAVTNWFQRMEFYQQASLGWFDTPLGTQDFEKNQDDLTESALRHSLEQTTNELYQVVEGSTNLTSFVSSVGSGLSDVLDGVVINASLPTRLTVLPEMSIWGKDFGPIYFETEQYQTIMEDFRFCTTFLWKLGFWTFVFLGLYYLVRKFVLGILFVIHVARNL